MVKTVLKENTPDWIDLKVKSSHKRKIKDTKSAIKSVVGSEFDIDPKFKAKIKGLQEGMFLEFKESDIYAPESSRYFYFSPLWHIESWLIRQAEIEELITSDDMRLLSVWSWRGYLEKTLVRLWVRQEEIVLSDINETDIQWFKSYLFDMYWEWSIPLSEKFDIIVFPESILLNVRFMFDQENMKAWLCHVLLEAANRLKSQWILRMNWLTLLPWVFDEIKAKLSKEWFELKYIRNNLLEFKRIDK